MLHVQRLATQTNSEQMGAMVDSISFGHHQGDCRLPSSQQSSHQSQSRMQTDGFASQPATQGFKNTWDCTRQLYRSQGLAGFTKGLAPTLIRYVLVDLSRTS